MFKSVMVVNVVAEGEPVIIDVDSVVVSRVEDSEAKVIIEIHMKIWFNKFDTIFEFRSHTSTIPGFR